MAKAVKVQKNWGPDRTGKVRRIQRKRGLNLSLGSLTRKGGHSAHTTRTLWDTEA